MFLSVWHCNSTDTSNTFFLKIRGTFLSNASPGKLCSKKKLEQKDHDKIFMTEWEGNENNAKMFVFFILRIIKNKWIFQSSFSPKL